ncbi:MAG: hypothetical protein IJ357_04890 [Oscillospiraceae bacterium]|nr:hypothetical protein [Oscillospiraceae bacterium]
MRKQGETYFKIITIVLAVVIGAYALISLFASGGESGYSLETAVLCEVGDGVSVSGFVVRSEQVLSGSETIVVPERTEGEWVGVGQRVATGYTNARALENRQELSRLEAELEQLLTVAEGLNNGDTQLDAQIGSLVLDLSAQAARGRYDAMKSTAAELEPLVLRSGLTEADAAQIDERIVQLRARISALSEVTGSGSIAINAHVGGYYSEIVDGYETILTPERVMTMSVTTLRGVQYDRTEPSAEVIGRLVTGQTWYYVTEVPAETAARCSTGSRLTVRFAAQALDELRMKVEYISEPEDEACVLVLSYSKLMQEVTALREQNASISFETYEGLRVPKQALYYIDGQTGVYILEGVRAEWKSVEILCEYGDCYVVELDKSDTDNLWPKDEIILTSEDIYDGKVMQ